MSELDQITAPYGFVPLADRVVQPTWLACKSGDGRAMAPPVHDVPFADGLCGTFELEITAETPIFTRGVENKELPFRLGKDGPYAIPGTAVRGALRNIVEIISFSRFSRVNDHRYAVRDLNNNDLYGQHMAALVKVGGKSEPVPLVNAGWLTLQPGNPEAPAILKVCDFAKFEYSYLQKFAAQMNIKGFDPGRKQSAVSKYKAWTASLEAELPVKWYREKSVKGRQMLSNYGSFLSKGGTPVRGTLVFTGQPQQWSQGDKHKKHHDFFFSKSRADVPAIPVDQSVFNDFEFAHSNRGQQNRLGESQTPNEEWAFWKARAEQGERVPVFFLTHDDGSLRAFGLAMMFRLPYDLSIHDAIKNASTEHLNDRGGLDFAEGLFGTVRTSSEAADKDAFVALKGRVGVSHGLARPDAQLAKPVVAVLGGPKASYYPNYVEQDAAHPGSAPGTLNGKPTYRTWMDSDSRPRGWKRYKTLRDTWDPPKPKNSDMDKVGTRFQPLKADTKFRCHIDIHNLRPQELGGLIWAIRFGGDTQARHGLGMARPLGYGRVRLSIENWQVRDMHGAGVDYEKCQQQFVEYMTTQVPGWANSSQIQELLALARPIPAAEARYQTLSPNQFTEAKKLGLALPSAAGLGQQRGWGRSASAPRAGNGTAAPPGAANLAVGNTVSARLIDEKTKKGGLKFGLPPDTKGVLHPGSGSPPEGFAPDTDYRFVIKAILNKELSLEWVDPSKPQAADRKPKGGPQRGGFHRGPGRR